MARETMDAFPFINLMPDRERVMGSHRPVVRPWVWWLLAVSAAILVAVMAILLVPRLV